MAEPEVIILGAGALALAWFGRDLIALVVLLLIAPIFGRGRW